MHSPFHLCNASQTITSFAFSVDRLFVDQVTRVRVPIPCRAAAAQWVRRGARSWPGELIANVGG